MQFPNMDEEDGDFNLGNAGRSRLSSLFQGEHSGGDINQALTYTAPKQPKKPEGQGNAEVLKLLHLAVVHAYKLENGNYANQGKLGCALLGNHDISDYKLLLYKGKQVHVTTCRISPSFMLHVQPNNYITFYDDKTENWSLMCESDEGCIDLVKQIALAKANSYGKNMTTLVVQDLSPGEGPGLGNGDSAELKYTGWLLTNFTFGQVFDSNMKSEASFRLRLGKSKIIKGWNEGLQGAQKHSQKLLIIPPALAYGAEGMGKRVPPNSILIFEIHVKKVKISRDTSHSPSPVKLISDVGVDKRPEVPPRTHSVSNEDTVRMRGASISEQLSQSPKKDKAHLISRMAKMGTATLPLQGAIPAQPSSESEIEDDDQEEIRSSPPVNVQVNRSGESSPKPTIRSRHNSTIAQQTPLAIQTPQQLQEGPGNIPIHMTQHSSQVSLYAQSALPSQQPYMPNMVQYPSFTPTVASQFPVSQQQYPMHSIPGMSPQIVGSMADTHLPLLITETRSQSSEVRLGLSKITDKVDIVIQKVDDLRMQSHASSSQNLPSMEGAILAQNIERIIQENSQLKRESETKNSKIQSLNEKVCDLLQRNQGFFEESNSMLEQRSDSLHASTAQSHARLLNLEQDKVRLSTELADTVSKLSELEAKHAKQLSIEKHLREKLTNSEEDMKNKESLCIETKQEHESNQRILKSLKEELQTVTQDKIILSEKIKTLEDKLVELEETKNLLEKDLSESQQKLLKMASDAASELEKLNVIHQKEIELLKSNLNQGSDSSSEVVKTEALLEAERLKVELEKLQNERIDLESRVLDLQKKLDLSQKSESTNKDRLVTLENEMEIALAWKKEFILKYESFHEKTRALKNQYENQIAELLEERKRLQESNLGISSQSPDFASEIKKVMNVLYKMLQTKINPAATYTGANVLETCLQTIRALTFQMLEMKQQEPKQSSEPSTSEKEDSNAADNSHTSETSAAANVEETDGLSGSNVDESELVTKASEGDEVNISNKLVDISEKINETSRKESEVLLTNPQESPSCNGTEESTSAAKESTLNPKFEMDNRVSPDIWKPQPPPLFDDDEDEDSDEWLK